MDNLEVCHMCGNLCNRQHTSCDSCMRSLQKAKKDLEVAFNNIKENGGDPEQDHIDADYAMLNFLRSLGMDHIAKSFENMKKWYS